MHSILVVQFRENPELIEQERSGLLKAAEGRDVKLMFVSALDENLSWNNPEKMLATYHGVILGGSGEFDFDGGRAEGDPKRTMSQKILSCLRPFISHLFEKEKPTLGICYGHQVIGAFHGVSVVHDKEQNKVGSYEVSRIAQAAHDPLLKDVPDIFAAQYGHKDSLSALPSGAEILCVGERCTFGMLRYRKNIYTCQFHPEMDQDAVIARLSKTPGYLPEGVDASEIIKPSPHASAILTNFFDFVKRAS